MSVLLSQYHPSDLVSQEHPELEFQFQDDVLNSEDSFKAWSSAYDIHEIFFDSEGNYLHMTPIENTPEFFDFVMREILGAFSPEDIEALTYNPQFTMPGTFRDVGSYTDQIEQQGEPAHVDDAVLEMRTYQANHNADFEISNRDPRYFDFLYNTVLLKKGQSQGNVTADVLQESVADILEALFNNGGARHGGEASQIYQTILADVQAHGPYTFNEQGLCDQYAYASVAAPLGHFTGSASPVFVVSAMDKRYFDYMYNILVFQDRGAGELTADDLNLFKEIIVQDIGAAQGLTSGEAQAVFDKMLWHVQSTGGAYIFNLQGECASYLGPEALAQKAQTQHAGDQGTQIKLALHQIKYFILMQPEGSNINVSDIPQNYIAHGYIHIDVLEGIQSFGYDPNRLEADDLIRALHVLETIPGDVEHNSYMLENNLFIDWQAKLDSFFDACLGAGTLERQLRTTIRSLENTAQRQVFAKLVAKDPRAQKYSDGTEVSIFDILRQEVSGAVMGEMAADLTLPDDNILLSQYIASPKTIDYAQSCGAFHGIVQGMAPSDVKSMFPELAFKTDRLVKDVIEHGEAAQASIMLDFDMPSPDFLYTQMPMAMIILLRTIFTRITFLIEQMRNHAMNMDGVHNIRSRSNMSRFLEARTELNESLKNLFSVKNDGDLNNASSKITKAAGQMIRESLIFKMQEGYKLSQFEMNAKAGTLASISLVGASVTLLTCGGTLALGGGALSLSTLGGGALVGTFTGAATQTGVHALAMHGGADEVDLTEVYQGAIKEQFMTAAGFATGQGLNTFFMSNSLFTSLRGAQPLVAASIEGGLMNVGIGSIYIGTGQVELDPRILGVWFAMGAITRGILHSTGIDDSLAGLTAEIFSEGAEEMLETLVVQGYISQEEVIQCSVAALRELGSTNAMTQSISSQMSSYFSDLGGQDISVETEMHDGHEMPDLGASPPPVVSELFTNPQTMQELRFLARDHPDTEVEVYKDAQGNYHYVLGDQGSGDMADLVVSPDEDGSAVVLDDADATRGAQPSDWQFLGHVHPVQNRTDVEPSYNDIKDFLLSDEQEHFILRMPEVGANLQWSLLTKNPDGTVIVSYSDPGLDSPLRQRRIVARIDKAQQDIARGDTVRVAAASADAYEYVFDLNETEISAGCLERLFYQTSREDLTNRTAEVIYDQITQGQKLSVLQRVELMDAIIKHQYESKIIQSYNFDGKSPEYKQSAVHGILGRSFRMDNAEKIQVLTKQGHTSSHVVFVLSDTDYLRLLADEKELYWHELSPERQKELRNGEQKSGFNIPIGRLNVTVISETLYLNQGDGLFQKTVLHEEMHHVNQALGFEEKEQSLQEEADVCLREGNYAEYFSKLAEKNKVRLQDEIMAFLSEKYPRYTLDQIAEVLNRGGYYDDFENAFDVFEEQIKAEALVVSDDELDSLLEHQVDLSEGIRNDVPKRIEQALQVLSMAKEAPFMMLATTPMDEWGALAASLAAKYPARVATKPQGRPLGVDTQAMPVVGSPDMADTDDVKTVDDADGTGPYNPANDPWHFDTDDQDGFADVDVRTESDSDVSSVAAATPSAVAPKQAEKHVSSDEMDALFDQGFSLGTEAQFRAPDGSLIAEGFVRKIDFDDDHNPIVTVESKDGTVTELVFYEDVQSEASVVSDVATVLTPEQQSIQRGKDLVRTHYKGDVAALEARVSTWPADVQERFWKEVSVIYEFSQTPDVRKRLVPGKGAVPYKEVARSFDVELDNVAYYVGSFFLPVEKGVKFRRLSGTPHQVYDFHIQNPRPDNYQDAPIAQQIDFVDEQGNPQRYLVPDYVVKKVEAWLAIASNGVQTETKGDFVQEVQEDGTVLIVDFIPKSAVSESLAFIENQRDVYQDGEIKINSFALTEQQKRVLGVPEGSNPSVDRTGLDLIHFHSHFSWSKYSDQPSPQDMRNKLGVAVVWTPGAGLVFYTSGTTEKGQTQKPALTRSPRYISPEQVSSIIDSGRTMPIADKEGLRVIGGLSYKDGQWGVTASLARGLTVNGEPAIPDVFYPVTGGEQLMVDGVVVAELPSELPQVSQAPVQAQAKVEQKKPSRPRAADSFTHPDEILEYLGSGRKSMPLFGLGEDGEVVATLQYKEGQWGVVRQRGKSCKIDGQELPYGVFHPVKGGEYFYVDGVLKARLPRQLPKQQPRKVEVGGPAVEARIADALRRRDAGSLKRNVELTIPVQQGSRDSISGLPVSHPGRFAMEDGRQVVAEPYTKVSGETQAVFIGNKKVGTKRIGDWPVVVEDAVVYLNQTNKDKYRGRTELITRDETGEQVILFTDANPPHHQTIFKLSDVLLLRQGGTEHDLTSEYSRVANPQFKDREVNESVNGKRVIADFSDPRLVQYIEQNILPIRNRLDSGEITYAEAAKLAWKAVSENTAYDKARIYGHLKARLFLLGDFVEQGVCNERGMLLQVAYQYLGIESQFEKGKQFGGRHAWVRITDDRVGEIIADPQHDSLYGAHEEGVAGLYLVDTETEFHDGTMIGVRVRPQVVPPGDEVMVGGAAKMMPAIDVRGYQPESVSDSASVSNGPVQIPADFMASLSDGQEHVIGRMRGLPSEMEACVLDASVSGYDGKKSIDGHIKIKKHAFGFQIRHFGKNPTYLTYTDESGNEIKLKLERDPSVSDGSKILITEENTTTGETKNLGSQKNFFVVGEGTVIQLGRAKSFKLG